LKAATAIARIEEAVGRMDAPRFITLTLRREREETLRAMIDRLFSAFRTLRSDQRWRSRVVAGVWVLEVTRGSRGDGWHAHVHAIIDGEYYRQQELSIDWGKASKGSTIVDIRRVDSRKQAARYVAKYVGKGADVAAWSAAEICDFARGIFRRRTLGTFGKLFGDVARVIDDDPNPIEVRNAIGVQRLIDLRAGGSEHAAYVLALIDQTNRLVQLMTGSTRSNNPQAPPVEPWEHELAYACVLWLRGDSLIDPFQHPYDKWAAHVGGPGRLSLLYDVGEMAGEVDAPSLHQPA